MFVLNKILGVAWLIALFGVANMAPVIFCRIPILGAPVDFGRAFRGKRIFGDHKTWRGIILAVIWGFAFFLLQKYLYNQANFFRQISLFDLQAAPIYLGALAGLGAIIGDLIKSFFKRRVGIAPGKPWLPFDQIDYIIGGLAAVSFVYFPNWYEVAMFLILGFGFHTLFRVIGVTFKLCDKII